MLGARFLNHSKKSFSNQRYRLSGVKTRENGLKSFARTNIRGESLFEGLMNCLPLADSASWPQRQVGVEQGGLRLQKDF